LIHALLTGLSMALANLLNIHLGFTFSGGAIDMALGWGKSTNGWMIFPFGLLYGVIYYLVFDYCIRRFDLKTPGREQLANNPAATVAQSERAGAYIRALGGAANLLSIDACTTRLRLHLADRSKAIDSELKALGAMAIVRPGNAGSLQVVVGAMADSLADELRVALPNAGVLPEMAATPEVKSAPRPIAAIEAQQWLAALGGNQVMQVDCVALTRLRVRLGADQQMAENRLSALGCLGLSQLDDGVWHVLVGNRAQGLSEAIKPMLAKG